MTAAAIDVAAIDATSMLTEKITENEEIIKLSNETSKLYLEFFENINMGFSHHRYNTFDKLSKDIAILSFITEF